MSSISFIASAPVKGPQKAGTLGTEDKIYLPQQLLDASISTQATTNNNNNTS
jgi:hypothetical protein